MAGETPPLLRCSHATGSACKLICRSHTRVFLFNYICMQYGRAGRACLCRAKPEQGVGCIVAHLQLAQGGVQLEPLGHRQHALQTRSFSLGQEAAWKLQPELGQHTAHAGPCCMGLEADWSRYQGLITSQAHVMACVLNSHPSQPCYLRQPSWDPCAPAQMTQDKSEVLLDTVALLSQ